MTAPSIPNLFSLRGTCAGRARAGRGRGASSSHFNSTLSHDKIIQATDTDASVSRISAVELGYLDDPFANIFSSTPGSSSHSRRLPIINRGTYTRTRAVDKLVNSFLSSVKPGLLHETRRQIISLGAGTDTRPFRLLEAQSARDIIYHELDFPESSQRKLHQTGSSSRLTTLLPRVALTAGHKTSWSAGTLTGCQYFSHGLDLRQFAQQGGVEGIALDGLNINIPTLLISECCLCYLEIAEAQAVIKWFRDRVPNLGIILYEPTKPDDAFGKTMTSNLAARGIAMPTLQVYRQPQDQERRLLDAGFEHAKQLTVDRIWRNWIPSQEKERVDALEGLDEVEEWDLLAGHYIVAWAWAGQGFEAWDEDSSVPT